LKTDIPGFGSFEGKGPGNVIGAGGGLAFVMTPQVELNVGATYNRLSFGDVTVNGSKQPDTESSGSSVTLQVGLTYVFGKPASASLHR